MSAQTYRNLAVAWLPESRDNRVFKIIVFIVLAVVLAVSLVITAVDVPPKERRIIKTPDRVAEFMEQKKLEATPAPTPEPTPVPTPLPTPKPKVPRKIPEEDKQPLTKEQEKAREEAEKTGVLALTSELADLFDTSDIDQQVGAKLKRNSANKAAGVNTDVLTAGVGEGSGGVSDADYVAGVGATSLDIRDVEQIKQSLVASERVEKKSTSGSSERTGKVRSEEEVTIVFDQHKGQLYSIYNRERRKKPGLKGKLVLEITIAPNGSVVSVKIKSSELNDPALERRLVARIKQFKFEAKDVEQVTVTFPVEFLPI